MRFEDGTLLDGLKNPMETADGSKGVSKANGIHVDEVAARYNDVTVLIVTCVRRLLEVHQTLSLQYSYDH